MGLLKQRAQVVCEQEGTEGTAETLEGADAFLAFDPHFEPVIEAHERNPVRTALSPHGSVFGKRSARMTFQVELVGTSAGAGNAIHYSDAIKACGVGETLVGGTSATYKPISTSIPSVTLAMYLDGKIYKMWGARGTARLLLEAGKPGLLDMEFVGADFSEDDGALLTSGVSYESAKPPTFQSASFTIDSYSAIISRLELDMGNTLALRPSANASSGNFSCQIADRRPTVSFDPENVLVATEDFLGNWRSGSEMALSSSFGATAGNTMGVTAPKVQYQTATMSDRDGISVFELVGLCCLNSGNDEWQIAIT